MSFVTDWKNIMITEIEEKGLKFKKSLSEKSLIIKYCTYLRKCGTQKPYKIFKSNEFDCPKEYEKGLRNLEEIIEQSGDISAYLSKDVENLNNDLMFNDWGVLHLHLGEKLESNSQYIERTGPVLFLCFKDQNMYFINIFNHQDWTKKAVLQIMYSNWPDLIEPFIIKSEGFKGSHLEYTEVDHLKLRKSGISLMLELTNERGEKFPIIPPGMGITSSGDSVNDVLYYIDQINEIKKTEELVRKNIEFIKKVIMLNELDPPTELLFKLIIINGIFQVKEENTELIFNLD